MDNRIEEMANDLQEAWTAWSLSKDLKNPYAFVAEILAKKWHPKISENAVVLTREKLFIDRNQLSKEKQIEIIHNIILENLDYGYEETARAIYDANYRKIPKLGVILPFDHYDNLLKFDKEVRKETVEKFAERLTKLYTGLTPVEEATGYTSIKELLEMINAVAKEITEGEV